MHVERLFVFGGHAEERRFEVIINQGLVEEVILVRCDLAQATASKSELFVRCLVERDPITKDLLLLVV